MLLSVLDLGFQVHPLKVNISFVMSVCPSIPPLACLSTWNLAPTGPNFMKFDMSIFQKSVEKVQV